MRGFVLNQGLIRGLPKPAAMAAASATLGLNALLLAQARHEEALGSAGSGLFQLVVLAGGLGVLAIRESGERSSVWARSLPVPARQVWTAHLRTLVLAVSVLVASMAAVVSGFAVLVRSLGDGLPVALSDLLLHFARPWLVLLAVALMLGSWRPPLADPAAAPGWRRLRWTLVAAAVVVLVAVIPAPLPVALLPVLLAGAWARRACRSLPPVLSVAERPAAGAAGDTGSRAPDGGRTVHRVVARQLFKWPLTWILGLPMVLLLGLVQGGAFSRMPDADFARYFNVAITVYLLVAFVGHFLENLYRVDHLPIPRGLLLRWLLVPGLVTFVGGGLAGTLIAWGGAARESLAYENDTARRHHGLLVPADLWRPVWGEPPRTVTAPWGEEQPVASVPVLAGWSLHLWKPWSAGPRASADFIAWQISRAAAAAHGVALAPELIRERYLVTTPAGEVHVRAGGLTLVADGLAPPRAAVGPVLALLLGTTIVLTLLTCQLVFRLCGPGATRRRVRTVFWSTMALLMLVHLLGYALLMTGNLRDWVVSGLVVRLAGGLGGAGPIGWIGTWVVAGAAVLAAWRLCARAFTRVEAVRVRPAARS